MNISVTYEDSDVAKVLNSMIKHPNKDEFVKLLTPLICGSSQAVHHLFKLSIGNNLPKIIPSGTLCYIPLKALSTWGMDKNKMLASDLVNSDGNLICKIDEFRGYHEYSPYKIKHKVINDQGVEIETDTYTSEQYLEIIEEF